MTELYKAVVLDPDACLERLKEAPGPFQLELTNANSAEELIKSVVILEPDVVFLDLQMPGVSGWELAKRLRKVSPGMPVVLLAAEPNWADIENDPFIEMVRSPLDPAEAKHRIARFLHGLWQEDTTPRYRLPNLVVEELRSDSGRIDAKKVAEMFDLSIPVLARLIGAGEQALYKTPDARSIQSKLTEFERIAWGLLRLTGSGKGLRIWLNTTNPDLDNELPIDYIKEGHVEDMAAMVEDVLLGHPS